MPAVEGARQPAGEGALVSEDDACARLLDAAKEAYDRLGCDAPSFPKCPAFLRPGGGSGCYEYYEDSVSACVAVYEDAPSCRELSPCLATAVLNETLETCELIDVGTGGAGGAGAGGGGPVGGAGAGNGGAPPAGGAPPVVDGGAAGMSGSAVVAGQASGGAGS